MHATIFDRPVLRALMRLLSVISLKALGWRVEGKMPDLPKFVLIAAPHTSNWDFPITMWVASVLKSKIYWMGKHTLFRWPLGGFFRWFGGIPVDRTRSNNMVEHMIRQFDEYSELILTIPPTGTRKKVLRWKTGFYHIAMGAGVPIVLGFLNYRTRVGGIGPVFYPSGDLDGDMKLIREFYVGIMGKHDGLAASAQAIPRVTVPVMTDALNSAWARNSSRVIS